MDKKTRGCLIALLILLTVVLVAYWAYHMGYLSKWLKKGETFRGAYGRTPAMTQCWIGGMRHPFFNACRYV